jgi:hypothetical protein
MAGLQVFTEAVSVPDEETRCYLVNEYNQTTKSALSSLGIAEVRYVVEERPWRPL